MSLKRFCMYTSLACTSYEVGLIRVEFESGEFRLVDESAAGYSMTISSTVCACLLPYNHHVHHRSTLHPARCRYRLVAKGVFSILIAAPAMRPLPMVARRWATTQSLTPKENVALLNAQRLQRPNSPHMTIYQPQVS